VKQLTNKFNDDEIFSVLAQAFSAFNKSADRLSNAYKQLNRNNFDKINKNGLSTLQELLYGTLESIVDGILIIDHDGVIQYANEPFSSITKIGITDLIGKQYNSVFMEDEISKVINNGISLNYKRSIDNNQKVMVSVKPIFGINGNIIGAIEIIIDNPTKTLTESYQDDDFSDYVSKLIKVMNDIIMNIVHRMRSPLGAIQLFAEMLESDIDEDKRSIVHDILASVFSLDAVLLNLLSSVQPITLHINQFDIISVLEESINIASSAVKQQGIKITKKYSEKSIYYQGDLEQIKQVYFNIILNSIQAMPKGGKLIILAQLSDNLNYIETEISDTGCGIPERLMDRVFTPFFTTKEGGTGLGLYVAYRIIQAHKGKIRINSSENGGTKVIIKLPINSPES
jgi:signal transduction histidine kinase